MAFFLDFVDNSVRDPNYPPADWGKIWRTVRGVTPDEWKANQSELRVNYDRIRQLIEETPSWGAAEISAAMRTIVHTAYHLGEIQQALCVIKT